MKTFFTNLLLFHLFVNVSPEYTRPAPRPLILQQHEFSDSDPQQVHISLVGKEYMKISWITVDKKIESKVEYGNSPGNYDATATGEAHSYRYFFYKSGKIHTVNIGPLAPATVYYYRCGGYGREFSFRTPPADFPVEFVVVGDLGQTEWTSSTLAHVDAQDYDVLLLPGDLSYADRDQDRWDSFGRLVEPYASSRPWMVTIGNHEDESIPLIYPNGFKAYNARWQMPYKESQSTSNLYYSFEVARCHIIMLGAYTNFDLSSDQYKWLQNDLKNIDRNDTPWVIVLLHTPWYNSNEAHKGEGEEMRKAMEQVLYEARADAIFVGHVHAYERFTRVYDNKEDQCGPIHVTIGDGGNREGLAQKFEDPSPSISLYREPSFGHGRLRVMNNTHAQWTWHRNNDSNSFVADHLWLQSLSTSQPCKTIPSRSSHSQNDEL